MRYRTVFTVSFDIDGPSIDSFYNVDMDRMKADRAKYLLTGQIGDYSEDVQQAINGMTLRARYTDGSDLYNLHSEEPMSSAEVLSLLITQQKTGTLKEFLNKARLKTWI